MHAIQWGLSTKGIHRLYCSRMGLLRNHYFINNSSRNVAFGLHLNDFQIERIILLYGDPRK